MRFVELFAGIGGFSLGLERSGMKCVGHVEIDPYAQKVLLKHWPDVPLISDVKKVKGDEFGKVDLLCGGFPCQDISIAGNQKGLKDENGESTRSGLYDEIIRIAGVCRPRYIVLENVANLISRTDWFGYVLGRLAQIGYDAEWEIIRASDIGAPHKRARIWIVAYPKHSTDRANKRAKGKENGLQGKHRAKGCSRAPSGTSSHQEILANTTSQFSNVSNNKPKSEKSKFRDGSCPDRAFWEVEPNVGRVADGIPNRTHRLKCLGNSLVPQIAEYIGKQIIETEKQ